MNTKIANGSCYTTESIWEEIQINDTWSTIDNITFKNPASTYVYPNNYTITYPSTNWIDVNGNTFSELNSNGWISTWGYDHIKYDDVVQHKSPNKIFKPGHLYSSAIDYVPGIYWFDKDIITLFEKKLVALCLGSRLVKQVPILKTKVINGKNRTRNLNRMFITKFLVNEKVIEFSWYENAELLSLEHSNTQFASNTYSTYSSAVLNFGSLGSSKWFKECVDVKNVVKTLQKTSK